MLYAWMDLETTGLDERKHSILELGICVTDIKGNKVELDGAMLPSFQILNDVASAVLPFDARWADDLSESVRCMHTANGLLAECKSSPADESRVELEVCGLLQSLALPTDIVLAGNSVHFDWRFLRADMGGVVRRVSHRMLDMTAVAIFADSMGLPRPAKRGAHRVTEDIEESLGYFRFYRERMAVRAMETL